MFFIKSKSTSAQHYQGSCLLVNASAQFEIHIGAFCFPIPSATIAEIWDANPDSDNVHKAENLFILFSWLHGWEREEVIFNLFVTSKVLETINKEKQ